MKKWILILAVSAFVLLVGACGNKGVGQNETTQTNVANQMSTMSTTAVVEQSETSITETTIAVEQGQINVPPDTDVEEQDAIKKDGEKDNSEKTDSEKESNGEIYSQKADNEKSDTEKTDVEKGATADMPGTINQIQIKVGDYTFTATMEDNQAVVELIQMMKEKAVVLELEDYSGFEKVGSLGKSLTRSDQQITTKRGDIVLYNGNNMVIFYGSNSWSYTRLGKIDDLTNWEKALGGGNVTVTLSLMN